jgi:segregation and condensation protein B
MADRIISEFALTIQELPAVLEAILFASGDPVSLNRLVEITEIDREVIVKTLEKISSEYENNPWGGLMIRRLEDEYVMCTKPQMKSVLERYFQPRSRPPMSQATYETLAVIAYNQPVTRAQVESVRGVSSDSIVSRLLERGWIEECGTLDAPGRPALFETSKQFLMEFGIESVSEMPALDLMMYSTIRDLEESLEQAAGSKDTRQMSIDNLPAEQMVRSTDEHS